MRARTVYSLLEEAASAYGTAPALYEPLCRDGETQYRIHNWIEYRQAAEEVAAGLRTLGLRKGDVVAIDSETRIEFYFADLGIMTNGSVALALYTSYRPTDLLATLRACQAKAVFVADPATLAALRAAAAPPLSVQWILLSGHADDAVTFDELRQRGNAALTEDPEYFSLICSELRPEDPAILYMTSGATGAPKMGFVSHGAVIANIDMGPQVVPLGPDHASITFLPSAHITQRIAMELLPIRCGMPVWFSEGLSKLPHELKSVRPTFFVAPPRVWERIYASICTEIRKRGPVTRRLFYGALGLGLEASRLRQQNKPLPAWLRQSLKLADALVFKKIRSRFGGRLRIPVSGSAPLGKDLADFYAAIGMPLYEGYGLTEGGIVCLNPMDRPKSGSIGKPFPGVRFKLGEDGELFIGGPTLFSGYWGDHAATDAILQDGWLATGDIAEFDDEGYVYITGRKKELLVSSNGKKIYPSRIESLFKVEPLVNQVLLLGDRMPYVAALFTLNVAAAESLKGMEPFRGRPTTEIVVAPPVLEEMKRIVARANKQLAPFEQIRKYHVLDRDFTVADGELTPTLKIRRAKVMENHRHIISALYMGKD